ncbi:hypothetical protein PC122_g17271 [Phytophthora cactorum]|nr:hypothetical protein PC122_g17271 [Phytophthora cactorum]
MMPINKHICAYFYETLSQGQYRCKWCGSERKQLVGTGYTNLIAHLAHKHEGFKDQFAATLSSNDHPLQNFGFVSQEMSDRFQVQDIESSDARSDTSLVDTNSVLELDTSANESESFTLRVLSPTQTNVAAGSGTAIPASRDPPAPLTATSRAGLSPNELARLSSRIPRRHSTHDIGNTTTYLSHTEQRRILLDKMMDKLASEASSSSMKCDDPSLFGLLMMMDERQSAREAELRREREEREAAREERERQ